MSISRSIVTTTCEHYFFCPIILDPESPACPLDTINLLVAVHGHPLGLSAQFSFRRWTDWPATGMGPCSAILLQCQQLFSTENFVMNLRSRLDQILKMCPRQEISQRHEFAVVLVFHVDDAPAVLAAPDLTAVDDNGVLRADDCEGYKIFDAAVHGTLFLVLFLIVVGIHAQVVESELLLNTLLEGHALVQSEGVGLGDDGNYVDDVGEFLEYHDVDGLETSNI